MANNNKRHRGSMMNTESDTPQPELVACIGNYSKEQLHDGIAL
jgi:hypothetical protein